MVDAERNESSPPIGEQYVATTRLEIQQIYKLIQLMRADAFDDMLKLINDGVPSLVNFKEPGEGETALHLAAMMEKQKMVKFLLSLNANPNVQDFKGRTPIMRAVERGNCETVELLAKNQASMQVVDVDGGDVITHCFESNTARHKQCLDICLAFGAAANCTANSYIPGLVRVCEKSDESSDMCLMVIEKGCQPNVVEKDGGKSALTVACLAGNELVIRALLQKGAKPNISDGRQKTSFHHAARKGDLQALKAIVAYEADVSLTDKFNNTPIHYAALANEPKVCQFLFQRGVDPTRKNNKGQTALVFAKELGSRKCQKILRKCEKLWKKQHKPNFVNPNPIEMVHFYDFIFERQEFLKQDLERCIIPNEHFNSEEMKKGNFVSAKDLVEIIKSIDAPFPFHDKQLKKKFFEAHDHMRKDVVEISEFISGKKYINKQYLMSTYQPKKQKGKKAGKKGKPKKGKKGKFKVVMPICQEAQDVRRPDGGPPEKYVIKQVLETDLTRFNRDDKPIHEFEDDSGWYLSVPDKQYVCITEAAKNSDWDTLKHSFENGTEVDTRDKYYKTSLMIAAAEGNIDLVDYLLAMGADVKATDNFKWTALHHGCQSGQVDVVHALLLANADGNAQTWNGASPLMRAIQSGKLEVVQFLLDVGVNVTLFNKREQTALDVAEEWASANIYNLIKQKYDQAPKPKAEKKKGPPRPAPNRPLKIPHRNKTKFMKEFELMKLQNGIPVDNSHSALEQARHRNASKLIQAASHAKMVTVPTVSPAIPPNPAAWEQLPTTEDLKQQFADKRERFGDEVDFKNYKMPLKKNIDKLIDEM